MVEAFHVDRTGALAVGAVLGVEPSPSLPAGVPALDDEWKNGLTRHGVQYALSDQLNGSTAPEWFFELVRRGEFPKAPSRFQTVFAFESIHDARAFRFEFGGNYGVPIVRVKGERAHRANMRLIRWTAPSVSTLANARAYWRGDQGVATPLWELLLCPPVTVLGLVGEHETP